MQMDHFRTFMEGYVSFLEEMAAGESEKYAALISYDAKRIDRIVTGQQAMNMRLSHFEEQREQEQEALGFAGLAFAEILDRLEPPQREPMQELFRRFEMAIYDIKYYNSKSLSFAKEGMQMLGITEGTKAPYTPKGRQSPGAAQSASLFEAKV